MVPDDTPQEDTNTEIENPQIIPEPTDEGKTVVGTDFRDIGMVTDVHNETLYVDPNTSLSDKVKQQLEWDGNRRTDLPIASQFIKRIEQEVVLTVARETVIPENVD